MDIQSLFYRNRVPNSKNKKNLLIYSEKYREGMMKRPLKRERKEF